MSNNGKFFALLFSLISYCAAHGQGWEQLYGGPGVDRGYGIAPSANGYVILGYNDPDQSDNQVKLIWVNESGDQMAEKAIENVPILYDIKAVSDGYVMTGTSLYPQSTGGFNSGAILLKTDFFGNEIWRSEHGGDGISVFVYRLTLTNDGGFVYTGRAAAQNQSNILLVKVNANGTKEWVKTIAGGDQSDSGQDIITTSDNHLLVTGEYADDVYLGKFSMNGDLVWEQTFGGINYQEGRAVVEASNGDFMITGRTINTPPADGVLLARTDENGNLLWSKIISIDGTKIFGSEIIQTLDGNFVVTGGNVLGTFSHLTDIPLIKIDGQGNEIWNRLLGGDELDSANGILETADSCLILIGRTKSFGAANEDIYLIKTDKNGQTFTNYIEGLLILDNNSNCTVDSSEQPVLFGGWTIEANKGFRSFWSNLDSNGNYFIKVDTGDYDIIIHPPNQLWEQCPSPSVGFSDFFVGEDLTLLSFPADECTFLTVDIGTPFLRRCFSNTYYIPYCNTGTLPADTPYIQITLDTFLNFLGSSIPLSGQNGNVLSFDLDTIGIGECGQFTIEVEVDCDAPLGMTHCTEAHIYPDSLCIPPTGWAGGSVEVDATCVDDTIRFSIKNKGNAILSPGLEFIVIEDDVILYQEQPIGDLGVGEVLEFSLEAGVATYRLEADQEPNHPGNSMPTVVVEGCGLGFTPGFVNQFPMDDADPFLDIDCRRNIGSYDPNDKLAFPIGYREEHFIEKNTDIEYLIRFQNTGTDTAFKVVIRDTLSNLLEVASVRPGASSHPYEMDISGDGILKFTFDNILLPDSTTNEPASHGFIKYRISQKENVPLGLVINNSAAIYFDFNEPIITNTTWHTIGDGFVEIYVSVKSTYNDEIKVNVYPNPFSKNTIIELDGPNDFSEKTFLLFDPMGHLIGEHIFENNRLEINGEGLINGVYYFKIKNNSEETAAGKLVVLK